MRRARRRPCSAPLRQAGVSPPRPSERGIPAAETPAVPLPPCPPPPPHHHPPAPGWQQRFAGGRAGMAGLAMRWGGKAPRCNGGTAPSRPRRGRLQPQPPRDFFFFFGDSRVWHPHQGPAAAFPGGGDGCARRGPRALPALHPLRRGSRAGAWPQDNGPGRRYKYPPASIFGLAGSQPGGREGGGCPKNSPARPPAAAAAQWAPAPPPRSRAIPSAPRGARRG